MANDVHKIKLLVLWDILCKNTDEDHALNTDEIANLLALESCFENIKKGVAYYYNRRHLCLTSLEHIYANAKSKNLTQAI